MIARSLNRLQVSAALRRVPPRAALPVTEPSGHDDTFKVFPQVHVGETDEQAAARFVARRAAMAHGTRG